MGGINFGWLVGCLGSEPSLAQSQTEGVRLFLRRLGEAAAPGGGGVRAVPRLCFVYPGI
jgi:hypothetical protein